ncbi:MAG: hypothetical protein QOH14_3892 [Pseudonocardiales bacterium]|nr:hypothetical protein [Pseudonocardiales bacterium]
MSLYISVAVWTSLALGGFGLVKNEVPRYRTRSVNLIRAPARLGARVGAG